jgi:hypothetical protein
MAVDNRLVSSGVLFLENTGIARKGRVGDAATILFHARPALAALLDWRWQDADPPVSFQRAVTTLPGDWAQWLSSEAAPGA